jgi:hypothetical protein
MSKKLNAKQKKYRKKHLPRKTDCLIYAVLDEQKTIRYCGQTRCIPEKKRQWLIKSAKRNPKTPFHAWLLAQIEHETPWSITILDRNGTWDVSEILWIHKLREEGYPLLNVLRGGRDVYRRPAAMR